MTEWSRRRVVSLVITAVTLVLALVGCSSSSTATTAGGAAQSVKSVNSSATAPTPSLAPLPVGPAGATAPAPAAASTTSLPVHLSVPAIGVSSGLQSLQLLGDGSLQAPSQWQEAGWFSGGVIPGDPGPALIAGHVDSTAGPAVFFKLKQLTPGDQAVVQQADGHTLTFIIDSVQEYQKTAFPTSSVYGPTGTPVLRLVTCTGDFDYKAHSYLDNLVVSSHLASPLDQ